MTTAADDPRALVLANLPLVGATLRRLYPLGDRDPLLLRAGVTLDDLAGESVLYLLRHCGRYDPARGAYSTWVNCVLRGCLWRVLTTGTLVRVPDSYQPGPNGDACRALAALASRHVRHDPAADRRAHDPRPARDLADDLEHLRHCLALLDPADRGLLEGKYLRGGSGSSLAPAMGLGRSSVNRLVRRALGRLRALYEGEEATA